MIGLAGRMLRWRRLRWFAIGTLSRYLLRRSTSRSFARSVDDATAEIEQRLPDPVLRLLGAVPADATRAGGSALVAARTARRVASGSRRAGRFVAVGGRRATDGVARIRSIGSEIGYEAEARRRELRAEYLRVTRGNAAADDALIDVRPDVRPAPLGPHGRSLGHQVRRAGSDDPLPEIDGPVRSGRWRAGGRHRPPSVDRVQRSYRPRRAPWDS